MGNFSEYYEARQRLNLSQYAVDILLGDSFDFMTRPSRSGMLNRIFTAYAPYADANIDGAVCRYRESLEERLAGVGNPAERAEFIAALEETYRAEKVAAANQYPRERAFNFQLDRGNYDLMLDWRDLRDDYHGSFGRYFKAVIEEYARKSYYEREGILLREKMEYLQHRIAERKLLVVTIRTHLRYELRPYCLCADREQAFHYLVGLSRPAGSYEEEQPAAFRLSRIEKITVSAAHSGKVTAEQAKRLEEKLKNPGVQFLLQNTENVTVRLTPKGKQMYDAQNRLRPAFTAKTEHPDGSCVLTLQCASMQAEFYFFKFGAEAEILAPAELRKKFKDMYELAAEVYR